MFLDDSLVFQRYCSRNSSPPDRIMSIESNTSSQVLLLVTNISTKHGFGHVENIKTTKPANTNSSLGLV